jgi:hypothetical protein
VVAQKNPLLIFHAHTYIHAYNQNNQVIDLLGQSDADTARATLVDQLTVMNDTLDHLLDGL